jgi:predicted ATPase with chaperone activity
VASGKSASGAAYALGLTLRRSHAPSHAFQSSQHGRLWHRGVLIRKYGAISAEGEKFLETAVARLGLSARAHDRILKVARTIADLDSAEEIAPRHLGEVIQYRTLDPTY